MSVVFNPHRGFRWNGPKYLKTLIPEGVPKPMMPIMAVLETISHIFRIVSLAVRLYANMLAGHMLILISIGLMFILSGATAYIVVPFSAPDRSHLLYLRGRDRGLDPGLHLRHPHRYLHRLGDRAVSLRRKFVLQQS